MEDVPPIFLRCIYSDDPLQGTPIHVGDRISWHYASFKGLKTARATLLESSFDRPARSGIVHQSSNLDYLSKHDFQWLLFFGCCLKLGERSTWQFMDETEEITFFVQIIGVNSQQISPHSKFSSSLTEFRRESQNELWKLFYSPGLEEDERRDLEQYHYTIANFVTYWKSGKTFCNFSPAKHTKNLQSRRFIQSALAALALRGVGEICRKDEETVENMGLQWMPIGGRHRS